MTRYDANRKIFYRLLDGVKPTKRGLDDFTNILILSAEEAAAELVKPGVSKPIPIEDNVWIGKPLKTIANLFEG
ncbi:MAG: hypothetical protein M1839_006693 [Geoglossum umbratile]|nr:MAG: hypothetical protein M1839_006693 [Geoglossum umbratile]